ncbi:MAG TPA: anaerobic ribonucleoside-triphosphate reductase activating protein [Treponema sp.]|nr:anaerobic ribonucleoside-triphosphate reductase activating protein [Treponema sp.]HPC70747.1 anaerobic ribonucleoside-triphosphate reductase activating protein [Treponema sp.]HRU28384.1 anaerobic ribonucleoside-triphosphate reductase activating protein [Treponema sp.]
MLRAGLQKTSLVDYPGILAAVVFLPYCNYRCPWCHNSSLVKPTEEDLSALLSIETINAILTKRKAVLEGVVITGGEPTLTRELPELIRQYKSLGFKVKLDTNGSRSDVLEALLNHPETRPDYIALDLKLSPDRYDEIGGSPQALRESADLIARSGVVHEYRTIVLPHAILSEQDIDALSELVDGSSPWFFSPFKPGTCLDPVWNSYERPPQEEVERLASVARRLGKTVYIRGLRD